MKTLLSITAFLISFALSSYKPLEESSKKSFATQSINLVEGLFGEEDCAPGMVWSFTRNGKELEYQSPYVFHFCPDNKLIGVGSDGDYAGNWYKDSELGVVTIDIYGPHEIFELVSGTWQIIEHSETALELASYEKGDYRTVRFQRIQR